MKRHRDHTSGRVFLILVLGLATGLSSGCGSSAANHTSFPPTATLAASPTTIAAGTSATLTWTSANAAAASINNGVGSVALSGSMSVTPSQTTTYAITVNGSGTATATAQATVTVTAVSGAPTATISANPTSISAGQSSTLTVTATNATTVVITDNVDSTKYSLPAGGGTQTVSPTATTIYTVMATGANNQTATAQATLTVTPVVVGAPTVTISANPTSITAGQSSTLTAAATNATTVVITDNVDSNTYPLGATGGTQIVNPTANTIYTATATGAGQTATSQISITVAPAATVTITANPASIASGQSSTLTVAATNANSVVITDNVDQNSYTLPVTGGTQAVSPTSTTAYTVTASGANNQKAAASATVTVSSGNGNVNSINHVIFMLQENRSFDTYFGMLNPYRQTQHFNVGDDGKDYEVDGIDDKLSTISNTDDEGDVYPLYKFATTCIDDESSAWLESYGDVDRYNFLPSRPIGMDGFVHNAEGLAKSCVGSTCSTAFTDTTGRRAMGYYDESFLNYYYYMASQFALSDRWFSPVSSKSIPNRIATFTGGTTQGLVKDPGGDDHLSQLSIPSIFQELDQAKVSWKLYYTVTNDLCFADDECSSSPNGNYPATTFAYLSYSYNYIHEMPSNGVCTGTTQPSSVVGDKSNSFCIDPNHVAPISYFLKDLNQGTLPSFTFIEAGFGNNDEHPGSQQSILDGQSQVASLLNTFMSSPSWKDSVFFLSYDEGGGPYDHVPPVPNHSNDFTDKSLGAIPDISQIAVNPDTPVPYFPCMPSGGTPTIHCDLLANDPGANAADAPAIQGFAAQLGFRLPNMIVSPFARRHYVSHTPMDHTAVIKFVENRFIGSSAHLTPRDAAQPNLLEFFDFNAVPWATPPSPPAPFTSTTSCTPTNMGP
jgi:phospholipase C